MPTKFVNYTIKLSVIGLLIVFCVIGTALASVRESSQSIALENCQPVVPGKIYRFIEGVDHCVIPMDSQEIQQKLNDPFAIALLRKGIFPDSAKEISEAIGESDLNVSQTSYVVGEGSQVPLSVAKRDQPRDLRYVITWGENQNDAQIMLSIGVPASQSSFHQVISWDDQAKAFNYYELRTQRNQLNGDSSTLVWSWAGNSPLARQPQTMGQGCYDCHHNGVPIMKELQFPWNNWHSQRVQISPNLVPVSVANEPFFQQRTGGEVFEGAVRSNFQKYYQEWLRTRYLREGSNIKLRDVNQMLSHVITNTTVNLKSVNIQSNGENTSPPNQNVNGISPIDTFLWDSILQTRLGLDNQPLAVTFNRDDYDQYLKDHKFALVQRKRDRELYREDGSTYFAYFVPQVSAEDTYMTQQLLNTNILTKKFVASVAMVDFQNPLFSEKRTSLQKYANDISEGTIINGVSSIPRDFASKVEAVASPCSDEASFDSCTAEEQFLYLWHLPDDQWQELTANQLKTYIETVSSLEPTEQLNKLMQLSVKQRNRFASTPLICNLFEFNLLIPETDFGEIPKCPALSATTYQREPQPSGF